MKCQNFRRFGKVYDENETLGIVVFLVLWMIKPAMTQLEGRVE
jgi:hypothetical protein